MSLAPIVLFVYNRLWHTQQTVEALKKNELAKESELFIFSDAPKGKDDNEKVKEVRNFIKTINDFKHVTIVEREENFGLAKSIITGVIEIVNRYDRIIVLEDDMISSPYFLRFMNDALEFYNDEEKVISIHGYIYPVKAQLPEAFFLRGADCWGWATWKRGWNLFEQDGKKLLYELRKCNLKMEFDVNGSCDLMGMLEGQVIGKNDSWAIRWHASAFLGNKLTLYPGKALVSNIGFDGTGRHCAPCKNFDVELSKRPILVKKIEVKEDKYVLRQIEEFYRSLKPNIYKRVKNKAVYIVGKASAFLKNLLTYKK